jgi:hypothetical protein
MYADAKHAVPHPVLPARAMGIVTLQSDPPLDPEPAARARMPWRVIGLCCLGYMLVLAAWSAPTSGGDDGKPQPEAWSAPTSVGDDGKPRPEHEIKAAFLYKFLGYVEWRGVFEQPTLPIVIGVLAADDIAAELRTLARGRQVGGHPIQVRRVGKDDALEGVHMLFVGRAESSRVPELAPVAHRRGVLLVTDYEGALDDGSAINLVVIANRVRFEVSLDATERSRLKLSSRLLAVALWVRPAQ